MSTSRAWQTAKLFIEPGTIEYFSDHVDFMMTGTNYELYRFQCAILTILPLEGKRLTDGYFFSVNFKDIREV